MSNILEKSMEYLAGFDAEVAASMEREYARQKRNIELIASENVASMAVIAAMGSVLTNKYAEGYPGKRYYGGCEFVDEVETLAIERAKALFGSQYANVHPHSGAQANLAAYAAMLVRHCASRGYGPARIREKLYEKGVPRELWEEAMEEAPDNESQIEAYLASRLRGRMPDEKEKKRLVDGLLRRGYPWSDVKRVMSRMLETYFED